MIKYTKLTTLGVGRTSPLHGAAHEKTRAKERKKAKMAAENLVEEKKEKRSQAAEKKHSLHFCSFELGQRFYGAKAINRVMSALLNTYLIQPTVIARRRREERKWPTGKKNIILQKENCFVMGLEGDFSS